MPHGRTPGTFCGASRCRAISIEREFDMHKWLSAFAALAVVAAVAMPVRSVAQSRERTKVGSLTCDISAGVGSSSRRRSI
jgi:hypothetical protein